MNTDIFLYSLLLFLEASLCMPSLCLEARVPGQQLSQRMLASLCYTQCVPSSSLEAKIPGLELSPLILTSLHTPFLCRWKPEVFGPELNQ